MPMTLAQVRYHLEQALVGLDALDRAEGRLDQRILDLLASADDGLSTAAITRIVRRRRQNVRVTLGVGELMATKPRTFDMEAEARRLFATAKSKGDFSGAAACLRLLRDLRPAAGEKPAEDRWVQWTTADEMNALTSAFDTIDAIERVAKARRELGGDPPVAHVIGAGSDQTFWRDTPETSEERQAQYDRTKSSGAPTIERVPTTDVDLDPLDEDEIDVTDLVEAGIVIPEEPQS
jgi:hypothetical protein